LNLGFDSPVADGGYRWWYVDALSADGKNGLTVIAFLGSVFSPFYARARRRGGADPLRHCAINVALYGRAGRRWTLTERGPTGVERSRDALVIGRSRLTWDGRALVLDLDEVGAPLPRRVRGRVKVVPTVPAHRPFALDEPGRHRWNPIGPVARVETEFDAPDVSWTGSGYLDSNDGDEPLENAFVGWNWSRARVDRGTVVAYDVRRRDGTALALGVFVDEAGQSSRLVLPAAREVGSTLWGIARSVRSEPGCVPHVSRTLEDTPFYARSLVETRLMGETVDAVHESLSLDRFRSAWVQWMLPFRMGRNAR